MVSVEATYVVARLAMEVGAGISPNLADTKLTFGVVVLLPSPPPPPQALNSEEAASPLIGSMGTPARNFRV